MFSLAAAKLNLRHRTYDSIYNNGGQYNAPSLSPDAIQIVDYNTIPGTDYQITFYSISISLSLYA
jgi:hypothetical protein